MRNVVLKSIDSASPRISTDSDFVLLDDLEAIGVAMVRNFSRLVCTLRVLGVSGDGRMRNCSSAEMASRVAERMPNLSTERYLERRSY